MPYKNQKQYRLPGWDYRLEAEYFITICTKDKTPHFGEVVLRKGIPKVRLSVTGYISKAGLIDLADAYPHLYLANWQIMPDHVQLILNVGFNPDTAEEVIVAGRQPLVANSVSSMVNHYKGGVTKACKASGVDGFAWQPRFHDRIIRNAEEYSAISAYIDKIPDQWLRDRELL